jgi:uncharacterized protein YxjI
MFSSGFDFKTPQGLFTAKKVPLSPTGEHLIVDSRGNQIARLETESFLSAVYNIIITRGGFYQFRRCAGSNPRWTCEGEGKQFNIPERATRKFDLSEETRKIAECSKARFFNDYEVRIFSDAHLKLAMCAFIALSLLEHQSAPMPD